MEKTNKSKSELHTFAGLPHNNGEIFQTIDTENDKMEMMV